MISTNITIYVHPLGVLRKFAECHEMELFQGATPNTVIQRLRIPEKVKIVPFVNGNKVSLNSELHDGDELKLVALVTGG